MLKHKNLQQYSTELAREKIRFYKPFERLFIRKVVEDVLSSSSTARIDLFAIFDGVSKRGGYAKVQESKRWIQIDYSLPYYKLNFKQIYQEHIAKKENEIKRQLKLYGKQYTTIEQTFVQLHFVSTSSAGGYYHFEEDQNSFCKQNFTHVDLYLNLKSICSVLSPMNKILYEYADKYLVTRKWLIMKGYSKPFFDEELDQLQIMKIYNNNASIALIGWNLTNLILALKLHQLKFNVILYTNLEKQHQMNHLERLLAVQEGVFYLDDGVGGPFSYKELLSDNQVETCEVSNYCGFIDENGRTLPEFRVRQSEESFLGLLSDFKFQESNKRTLMNQLISLIPKKKIKDELDLMKWHMERYLMLNNLHGEQTTVNTHSAYLGRRKHKIYMSKKRPLYIKNCIKLLEKAMRCFSIVQAKPKSIDFCNNMWLIEERLNQRRSFSSLVYSDSQQVYEMVSKRNFRIPNMQHQNFTVIKDLSSNTWVNCYFKFNQKLKLNPDIMSELLKRKKDFNKTCYYDLSEENCSFQFSGQFGFYYYFVIEDGKTLLARCKVEKFLLNSSTLAQLKQTLSTQMLKQFESNLLIEKLPGFSYPEVVEFTHFFYIKQEVVSRDRIVKLKNWQRMYLSIGIPWALNANKLTSQIDISNQILALISNVYYHLYKFDQKAKQNFSKDYQEKKIEIAKREKELQNMTLQASSAPKQQNGANYMPINTVKLSASESMKNIKPSETQPAKPLTIPEPVQIQHESSVNVQVVFKMHPNPTQVFSTVNSSQTQTSNKDPFGFQHHFIKSTFQYLTDMISKLKIQLQSRLNNKKQEKQPFNQVQQLRQTQNKIRSSLIEFQQNLQLQKPFKLYKNLFLHSFGHIRLTFPSLKTIINKIKQIQHELTISAESGQIQSQKTVAYQINVKFFDSFMIKRQYYSLDNPSVTSVYVHCVLFVDKPNSDQEIPLFIIFQETNLALFYYHTSYTKLISTFNRSLQKQTKKFTQKFPLSRGDCMSSIAKNSKRISLIFQDIRIKIQEQLKFENKGNFMSQTDVFDKILSDKFKPQVPQQVYQNPSDSNVYTKILYPENNEQKCQFLIHLLNIFTEEQLQRHGLKTNVSLLDIFFGYFSSKFFVFQMYWTKQHQLFSKGQQHSDVLFQQILSQIEGQDPLLFNEIQQAMDESSSNYGEDFPISLQFDQTGLQVQRKFLAGKNDPLNFKAQSMEDSLIPQKETTERKSKQKAHESYFVEKCQLLKNYIFIKQFSFKDSYERKNDRNRVKCFMMIGENDKRIELDPRQDPLQLIVSILVDTWDYEQIYDHFRNMIQRQILNCEHNLSPRMKLYYQATRKKTSVFSIGQVNKLRNILSYKRRVPLGKDKKINYKTEYCHDEDDRQTILEHMQNETMVFADGEIIICKH